MTEEEPKLPCDGKLAFDTRAQAQAAATTAAYQRGARVAPYKCTQCSLWHLASKYDD
ncbi:MAG: hypothetical protein WAQ57_01250 [Candidatus Saccharimonadales bacterium]